MWLTIKTLLTNAYNSSALWHGYAGVAIKILRFNLCSKPFLSIYCIYKIVQYCIYILYFEYIFITNFPL